MIGHASLASERCVAADEICVKGVWGCCPNKHFCNSRGSENMLKFASRHLDALLAKYAKYATRINYSLVTKNV